MNDTVKVSEKATRAEGSSIYLKPGENIKLEGSCIWVDATVWK